MPSPDSFLPWLTQYGSFALFGLLAVGIFGLPIPDETLMVIAGYLILKGQLDAFSTFMACLTGSISGITLSYILGRVVGNHADNKFVRWLGITEPRLARVRSWFERIGKWTLTFGYFVPGLRHFTGYVAGASHLDYKRFALFAYSGALFWVTVFLALGYCFGEEARQMIEMVDVDILWALLLLIIVAGAGMLVRKYWLQVRAKQQ